VTYIQKKHTGRQTDRQRRRWREKHIGRQTDRQIAGKEIADRQIYRQTQRDTDIQRDRATETQRQRQIDTYRR